MAKVFALVKHPLTAEQCRELVGREDEEGTVVCTDERLHLFLDGLILEKRGVREPGAATPISPTYNYNLVLRKLRIAFTLRDSDTLELLAAGGHVLSKAELSAFFRNPNHRSYRDCQGQVMRKFLKGLSLKLRPEEEDAKP